MGVIPSHTGPGRDLILLFTKAPQRIVLWTSLSGAPTEWAFGGGPALEIQECGVQGHY